MHLTHNKAFLDAVEFNHHAIAHKYVRAPATLWIDEWLCCIEVNRQIRILEIET
jgi:hypothetical protein